MPGPLTYAAITLLARDRIGQIKRALSAKQQSGNMNELERHVLYLATQAQDMMQASQPVIEPPVRLYGPPLTDQVSRFTLLGAIGPDLPRFAAYFAPGQRWLFDTLHKGTPDENRERVLANSTTLVFDFWQRVGPLIDADIPEANKRTEAKKQMRAYVLGHLCHVAADVLSHPYFESIEARLIAPPAVTRIMHRDDVAGSFDVQIASQFFGRGTDTHTKKWADWFPTPGDVPAAFAKAMAASIESIYGLRVEGLPAFEEDFKKIDPAPPPLSVDLINESITSFRTIIEIERVWTLADWLGATAAMFLPMGLAYFGALALPLGKNLSRPLTAADGHDADGVRTYESVVYPLAVSSLGPLVSMIIVSASGRGLRAEGITGWIQAGYSIVATVGFFASLGGAGPARWTLWFAIPLILAVAQTIFAIIRGDKENSRKLLWLGPMVQVGLAMLFLLLYRAWLHDGVEELQKDSNQRNNLSAFGDFAAWMGIVAVLWFINAVLFRWVFSSSVPDDKNDFLGGEPRQFLRLYDDVGLVHDLGKPFDSDHLADLAYPPARRPIVKFWWTGGPAAPQVQVNQDRIVFTFGGGNPPRTVFAPLAPITIEHWATLLATAATGNGALGTLHTKPARDDEKGIELSFGSLFSDNGDDKTKQADHDLAAAAPVPVSTSEASPSTLFHAPRPRLAEQMGTTGVAPDAKRPLLEITADATHPGSVLQFVSGRQYHATNATDASLPLLRTKFRLGDVIEIASAPAAQRIVEDVLIADVASGRADQTDIILSSAFPAALVPAAGIGYKRAASDRTVVAVGGTQIRVPTQQANVLPADVEAVTNPFFFGSQLRAGDVISIKTVPTPQRRVVVAVKDLVSIGTPPVVTSLLTLDATLAPPPTAPIAFERVTAETQDGFPYTADADDVLGDGGSVMNDAADLAALLCLGAASRLQDNNTPGTPIGAAAPVHRVSQVFRNWNLDRRRVNEWKTMVTGGASSERRGDYRASEEAAPPDRADAGETLTDDYITKRKAGEATVLNLGWLGVFRSWVDVASHPSTNMTNDVVFRPGGPSNRDLTRAMAYLLDASPAAVP